MLQPTSLFRAAFQSPCKHLMWRHHVDPFRRQSLSMGFEAVKKIAAWQALHDRFQYIVLGPLSLLMCFWFPTMLTRPWTGASIRRHGISGVRRWFWITYVSYCLWNRSPQGWIFNFAGGRWRRGLRRVANMSHKIFIDELHPGIVADCGLSLEPHRFNIGKGDQESFCCFLSNSISQFINGCNESLLYGLSLEPLRPSQHYTKSILELCCRFLTTATALRASPVSWCQSVPFREDPCCCVNAKRLAMILPLTRGKYCPYSGDVSAVRHPCVFDAVVLLLWRNLRNSRSRKNFAIANTTSSVRPNYYL